MSLTDEQMELVHYYLPAIQSYLNGGISEEGLQHLLVEMANDGMAWRLTGPLRAEFDQRLADGRIVGVIQNVWHEFDEQPDPCCFEKAYMTAADATFLSEALK